MTSEYLIYGFLVFYSIASISVFIGLDITRKKEGLEFSWLEIPAAFLWWIGLILFGYDWMKSKWK